MLGFVRRCYEQEFKYSWYGPGIGAKPSGKQKRERKLYRMQNESASTEC